MSKSKTRKGLRPVIHSNYGHNAWTERYRPVLTGITDAAYMTDRAGTVLFVNDAFEKNTLKSAEGFIGKPFTELFERPSAETAAELHCAALRGGDIVHELTLAGSGMTCEVRHFPLKDEEGNIALVCGIARCSSGRYDLEALVQKRTEQLLVTNQMLMDEIFERKKAEFELKKLGAVIEQTGNIIFITDDKGRIEYVNRSFEEATGYSRGEIIGQSPCVFVSGKGDCKDNVKLLNDMFALSGWQGTLQKFRKDGTMFWTKGVVSPVTNDDGETTHYFSVFEDITDKKASSEKLVYLTNHDPVTGLLNRSHFIETLNSSLGQDATRGALLLLDIDEFKLISDSYGHGMGDEFLRRAAKLIQLNLRYFSSRFQKKGQGEILLSRLSGDEFAVFLPNASRIETAEVAEHIRKAFEGFYQSDIHCHMTVSIGVALYPEHGGSATDLLTRADAAMYRAKDKGRNRFHLYSPEEREIEQMHTRLKWKERILIALKEDRFEPWFQPIMEVSGSKVTHYEALARMKEADGSIVLPGPFIDIAERFGLVGAISRAIFSKAFDIQGKLRAAGRPVRFCLNVSGKELGDHELLEFIKNSIFEKGLCPEDLVFEITETASIDDMESAISFISSLKEMGCRVSLDDFGIGYTSFLYLREMQVDYVKIAGSFIKSLDKNLDDQRFVKAITEVAKGMGIKIIAEFVETPEILGHLHKFGIDYAQGYLIGRPAPALLPTDRVPHLQSA